MYLRPCAWAVVATSMTGIPTTPNMYSTPYKHMTFLQSTEIRDIKPDEWPDNIDDLAALFFKLKALSCITWASVRQLTAPVRPIIWPRMPLRETSHPSSWMYSQLASSSCCGVSDFELWPYLCPLLPSRGTVRGVLINNCILANVPISGVARLKQMSMTVDSCGASWTHCSVAVVYLPALTSTSKLSTSFSLRKSPRFEKVPVMRYWRHSFLLDPKHTFGALQHLWPMTSSMSFTGVGGVVISLFKTVSL